MLVMGGNIFGTKSDSKQLIGQFFVIVKRQVLKTKILLTEELSELVKPMNRTEIPFTRNILVQI